MSSAGRPEHAGRPGDPDRPVAGARPERHGPAPAAGPEAASPGGPDTPSAASDGRGTAPQEAAGARTPRVPAAPSTARAGTPEPTDEPGPDTPRTPPAPAETARTEAAPARRDGPPARPDEDTPGAPGSGVGAGGPDGHGENPPTDGTAPTPADAGPLTDRDLAILGIAARTFPNPGVRDRVIRERLGMSPTRYHQLLNALLDDPAALARDPVTVNRLRRLRDLRRSDR